MAATADLPAPHLTEPFSARASPAAPVRFSVREAAVLRAFAAGQKGPDIARALGIGYRTLKRDIADLQERLAAPTMFVLGMRAVELGLLSPDDLSPPDGASPPGEAVP
jgi:DNA-binding NarL/FixJ family response regulator